MKPPRRSISEHSLTVNGQPARPRRGGPRRRWPTSSARTSGSPARTSAASTGCAAPARCCSTASRCARASCSRCRPTAATSRRSRALAARRRAAPVQQAFRDNHGLQCGFCTPGFVLATALPARQPDPTATRSATRCRATSAAAPATRASSTRSCTPPRPATAAGGTDAGHRPARRSCSAPVWARRGPAVPDRPGPLRRRHRAARHAAHRVRAERPPTPHRRGRRHGGA